MLTSAKFDGFVAALYRDSAFKNSLVLWAFVLLVFPSALLVSLGIPEQPTYLIMVVLFLPLAFGLYTVRPVNKATRTERGVVKWFNDAKGYGFISRPNGEEVFVHLSAIQATGFRTLQEGEQVQFDAVRGPKGWEAENVKPA